MNNPFFQSLEPSGSDAAIWCDETADILIQTPTETAVANFCIDTRIAFASFFEHRIERGVVPRVALESVGASIERVLESGVAEMFPVDSNPNTYLKSIAFRNSLIKLLIEDKFRDVLRELARNCNREFSLEATSTNFAHLTPESVNAISLAAASLHVVQTTTLLLLSELQSEVGPFARATNDHTRIAKFALMRGTVLSNAASDLATYHSIDDADVSSSIEASRECLRDLRHSFYDPLDGIASQLVPDDDSLEESAKHEFALVRAVLPEMSSRFSERYLRFLQRLPTKSADVMLRSSLTAVANQNEESLRFVRGARPFTEAS